ncbi:hypothetical protein K402DRAFT_396269 [Aulographum hederae CBS 113979]|uniref:Uncharacterized protein n=1 Tax=Aulographum hederae CBS 113979 TaxID=1176131 RepID=A0A6G1GSR5_9PEZI|nr:hypothetical protein K402DRAFT_396269 [Aulographum hederae CBS 113979]
MAGDNVTDEYATQRLLADLDGPANPRSVALRRQLAPGAIIPRNNLLRRDLQAALSHNASLNSRENVASKAAKDREADARREIVRKDREQRRESARDRDRNRDRDRHHHRRRYKSDDDEEEPRAKESKKEERPRKPYRVATS